MKRILSFCLLLLIALAAQAQDTKYTVTLNVPEDGTLNAYAGIKSGDYISRRSEFAAGEEVHLTGSLKAEYSCTGWTDENGTLVCDSLHYIFTMPARNVVLTGHTTYDPANPPGPREDGYTDTWNRLYLRSNPEFGGTFTWGLGGESAQNWLVWTGYEFTVTAYPKTGFKFAGWQLDGKIISTDNPYTFTMPERDMTLYAMYDYDPETPANPHGNVWNKESGELIISEFVPGHLYEKVREVTSRDPWHSDWDLIKSATIDGPSTDASLTYDYPIDISVFTNNAGNVEYIDYSRTSGITKVPRGCFSKKSLKQIVLPATIRTIGEYAFRNCESLTTVTCFATTPPTFEGRMPGEQGYAANDYYNNWAFDGLNKDNVIVHVPAEAVPLYQQARGWKELMILPITTGVQRLTVTLPQPKSYNDMFLELVNTKTLQSQRYVITNATSYTFNNLIRHTQHVLYLKNQRGDVLGTIEGIDIQDKDLQVSFADLKTPIDVTLRLLLPDGTALPSLGEGAGVGVTWTDRQGNYLATGATLTGQLEGTQVRYRVKLDETLGRQYLTPPDSLVTVGQSSIIHCQLSIIPQLTLSGTVTAESTGKPVRGATVTVSQMLNGVYPVTQSTKTDIDGHYTLTVYEAPTTITVTHSSFLKATLVTDNLPSLEEGPGVGFALHDLSGTIIDLDLYYTPAVYADEEAMSQEGYDGYGNITYTVVNETTGQELSDISVQYPVVVLIDQELAEGTRLRLTATSITGSFMPITTTCTVGSDGHATAIFGIKEMGQLKASFEMTDNMQVMGVLYDADGQLVGWAPYKDTELTVTHLKDGDYTLVTMGYSAMATSVASLDRLYQFGIRDNDMVKNEVSISSGRITTVTNSTVPLLDDSRFSYTSDATLFGVNKDEVSVGSYVTLRADLHFKPQYQDMLSKVRLQFDLPEGVEMVENSMMVGNKTVPYEMDGRQITVLIDDMDDEHLVRFCVVPTRGGLFEVSAGTRFRLNGSTTLQPIGTVRFSATDLTINAPQTTGRRLLPVTGMAVPLSKVEVYDDGALIGETTSLGTGYWSVMCPLDNPYNLSEHGIYAVITTPEGLQMQSEKKTVKVNRGSLTPVVTLRLKGLNHEHNTDDFVFDFRTNTVTPGGMNMRYADSNFEVSLFVDFYDQNDMLVNDTTAIRNVKLHILRERGDVLSVDAPYSERHKRWKYTLGEASDYSVGHNLPVNVDVEYTNTTELAADREMLDDMVKDMEDLMEEGRQAMKSIYEAFDDNYPIEHIDEINELASILQMETQDASAVQREEQLVRAIVGDDVMDAALQHEQAKGDEFVVRESDSASIDALLAELDDAIIELTQANLELRDSLLSTMSIFYLPDTTAFHKTNEDVTAVMHFDGKYQQYDVKHLNHIDPSELLAQGYQEMPMNDGSSVYRLVKDSLTCFIDSKTLTQYSVLTLDEVEGHARYVKMREDEKPDINPVTGVLKLFPVGCVDKFADFGDKIKDEAKSIQEMAKNGINMDTFLGLVGTTCNTIDSAIEILKCLYDWGRGELGELIDVVFAKKVEKATANLAKAQEKVTKLGEQIAAEEAKKMTNLTSITRHSDEIARLNGELATAVTQAEKDRLLGMIGTRQDCINNLNNAIAKNTQEISKLNGKMPGLQSKLGNARRAIGKVRADKVNVANKVDQQLPKKFGLQEKLANNKFFQWLSNPPVSLLLKAIPFGITCWNATSDVMKWIKLRNKVLDKMPCDGNETEAARLLHDCESKLGVHICTNIVTVAGEGVSLAASTVPTVPLVDVKWWAARFLDLFNFVWSVWQPSASENDRNAIQGRLDALKCGKKKPNPEHPGDPDWEDDNPSYVIDQGTLDAYVAMSYIYGPGVWLFSPLWFVRDPAGYVYEAVSSNRVEGVRTTCYYKETKEDMYGDLHDEAVIWDAETYAQENPLFTDADGRYQWDVPTGLWQVKYEKQGYETTYCDWLPVPPPQLEVNVGITQLRQPNVQKVKAYTDGIDITFDKYMRPHTLTAASIFLTSGGQQVPGTIELLNAESGYQTPDSVYASKVRFIPSNATLNANDKVMLTVRRTVESYAGVPMEQDFTQQFTVAQRIEALVADSALNLQEGKQATIVIQAVPAAAAKGKKVVVSSSDAEAVAVAQQETTLDSNGAATVALSAEAQGTSIVRFTLADEEELTTTTLVTVRDAAQMQVSAPRSSRLNGITLYIGSEIRLSCKTSGATILYTLDGSCPCAPESGKVLTYTGPIVLTSDSIRIKAMAVAPGMDDSPVVEFSYKGIQRPSGIEAPTVPNSSHVAEQPVLFFRLDGQRISRPEHGINIVRQSDGTVHKVTVR